MQLAAPRKHEEKVAATIPEPQFLSAPKAATLCGVSRNTICCWIRSGKLPSYRTAGGKNLIRPADLLGFMRAHQMFVAQALVDMAAAEDHAATTTDAAHTTRVEPAILVVDDDTPARTMAVRALQRLGNPLLEARTGYEALHLLLKHPEIALIILDLVMPGQHGAETYAEVRRQNKALPVIIVTGYSPDPADKMFGDVQPDLIILKPYDPLHLVEAARAYLADIGF